MPETGSVVKVSPLFQGEAGGVARESLEGKENRGGFLGWSRPPPQILWERGQEFAG